MAKNKSIEMRALGLLILVSLMSACRHTLSNQEYMDQCDACKKRGYACQSTNYEFDGAIAYVHCEDMAKAKR